MISVNVSNVTLYEICYKYLHEYGGQFNKG